MTTRIKIENESRTHVVHVAPIDMAGDPPAPVSAGALTLLPGQHLAVTLHELRSLLVYEGDAVNPDAPAAPVVDEAPREGVAVEPGADVSTAP